MYAHYQVLVLPQVNVHVLLYFYTQDSTLKPAR